MCVCGCVCLCVCMYVCLSVCLSVCLYVCLSVCLSLSVCLYARLPLVYVLMPLKKAPLTPGVGSGVRMGRKGLGQGTGMDRTKLFFPRPENKIVRHGAGHGGREWG